MKQNSDISSLVNANPGELYPPTKAILIALPNLFTNVISHGKYPFFGNPEIAPDVLCFKHMETTHLLAICPNDDHDDDDQWFATHKSSLDEGGIPSRWQISGKGTEIAVAATKYLNGLRNE